MIVADTDVLIDALQRREPAASRVAIELRSGSFATTAVSAFELRSGARSERARRAIDAMLAVMRILPVTSEAADLAAGIRRDLEARGTPIGMADYLIAGTCLAHGGLLLTRNRVHFERVDGLPLGRLGAG